MRQVRKITWAGALGLLAAACSSGDEAGNDAAQANAQAEAGMNAMANDPNNPFGQAEAQMHQRMMAAAGADPSETWIRKMIEHHRGAIAMADVVLAQNPTPEVRTEAERTRTERAQEIAALERLLRPEPTGAQAPAAAAPAGRSTSAPRAAPAQPSRPRDATNPAPKPPPRPPAPPTDPHAGHDMNNMSSQ